MPITKTRKYHIPTLDGLSLLPILNRFLNVKPSQSHYPETPKDDGSINKFDKTRGVGWNVGSVLMNQIGLL